MAEAAALCGVPSSGVSKIPYLLISCVLFRCSGGGKGRKVTHSIATVGKQFDSWLWADAIDLGSVWMWGSMDGKVAQLFKSKPSFWGKEDLIKEEVAEGVGHLVQRDRKRGSDLREMVVGHDDDDG